MRTAIARLPGHPDEACDFIAEAIVDEYVRRDPLSRVRVSVSGGRGVMFVAGDILSQADFDVSALVKRTLGSLGVTDDVEPFVSLEPVATERVAAVQLATELPLTVTGYATDETDVFMPRYVVLARRIAAQLERLRESDTDCFWLGPDAEVVTIAQTDGNFRVVVRVEHGIEPLERVRTMLTERLNSHLDGAMLEVNPAGPCERRGLALVTGSSNVSRAVYGSTLPSISTGVGRDAHAIEKAGVWLTRAAAIAAVKAGAHAALVHATYLPGEMKPISFRIRDERGRDLTSTVLIESMSLERVAKEWAQPGLGGETLRGGIVGTSSLPWEM
ncbi:MAG: S-adenosylmethionine synthetase N-terminal domain-containing protein [Patescibacteria group bacterium]